MTRLEGRTALVTGAGTAVGAVVARTLAGQGARVTAVDTGKIDALADAEGPSGGLIEVQTVDVSDFAASEELVQQLTAGDRQLDIVVNAASLASAGTPGTLFEIEEKEWDGAIDVCLKSAFNVSRHAASYWRTNRGRPYRLVNMIEPSGLFGASAEVDRQAALMALVGFTYSCTNALGRYGVTSNILVPLGTTPESLVEVGSAAAYLASPESDWINGHIFAAGDGRIALISNPEIKYKVLMTDDWTDQLVFDELWRGLRSSVEHVPPAYAAVESA